MTALQPKPSRPKSNVLTQESMSEGDRLHALVKTKLGADTQAITDQTGGGSTVVRVQDAVTEDPTKVKDPATTETPVKAENPASTSGLTLEQVQGAIAAALLSQNEANQKALTDQKAELQGQIDAANATAATATAAATAATATATAEKQARQTLVTTFGLDRMMGNPDPVKSAMGAPVLTTTLHGDRPIGAVAELMSIVDRLPKTVKSSSRFGQFVSHDHREVDRFVKLNRAAVVKDMETWGRANGLFRGSGVISTDAAVTRADLPGGFLETLSAIMRSNNRPSYIFHQFPNVAINFAKGRGDTVDIPRSPYLATVTDPADYQLSGSGVYAQSNATSRNLQTGIIQCVIQEYGMGKTAATAPIGIPEFVAAYSMINLMSLLDRNIGFNYMQFEDLAIRRLWDPSSRVVYNDNSEVTTTLADLAVGDGGQLTEDFLNNLYAYMRSIQIPTYMDGCYGLAANTLAVTQYKNSLDKYAPATALQIQDVTNVLNVSSGGEMDQVTGYLGKFNNFHIFETNAFGVGAAGTEGAQNETIAGSPRLTRTSYAFGADTIGRGIGAPMTVRRDSTDDFGRIGRYAWFSEEGFCAVDVDPTGYNDVSAVPQQLRVVKIHTTAVKL
jgi:hypothetical protein